MSVCVYVSVVLYCFFFFKQKTAYEMRISDWSSDVCSSDLALLTNAQAASNDRQWTTAYAIASRVDDAYAAGTDIRDQSLGERDDYTSLVWLAGTTAYYELKRPKDAMAMRSEEHTSELQSLMRISYAVLCLKKKRKEQHKKN